MTFALITIISTLIVLSPVAAAVLLLQNNTVEWIPWIAVGTGYLLVAAFGTVFLL